MHETKIWRDRGSTSTTHIEAKLEGCDRWLAVAVMQPHDTILGDQSYHRAADVQVAAQGNHTPTEAAALAQMLQAAAVLATCLDATYLSEKVVPLFHPDEHVTTPGNMGGRIIERKWREDAWQYRILYDDSGYGDEWVLQGDLILDGLARNYLGAIVPKDASIHDASVKLYGMPSAPADHVEAMT